MLQHYTTNRSTITLPANKKSILIILAFLSLIFALYTAYVNIAVPAINTIGTEVPLLQPETPAVKNEVAGTLRTDSVASVVTKALYFKTLLTTAQITTLEQTYTTTLARRWSNLPCGSGCRNGLQFSTLTAVQLSAALDVIKAAAGTGANQGYSQFNQIRLADKKLKDTSNNSGYDSTLYFISFLNTPTTTGTWMLQYGGHHYAANIAYNAGKVVGTTPTFEGVEPRSFVFNSVTYAPLNQEHDSLANMLASLTTAQLNTAKLSGTFSDVTLAPGESNGGSGTFPTTKLGLVASGLTTAQKNLIIAAIKTYTSDVDDSAGAVLQAIYASEIDGTYIGWSGSGTSGTASTFLNANTNYVRIDGPNVWIEFVCQSGVIITNQIHYHSVYRDHYRDYGSDLSRTTLPLKMLSFNATSQNNIRTVSWSISQSESLDHFEVEYSANPSSGFTSVGKVQAINTLAAKEYTFTDSRSVTASISYYRLKLVDKDGSITYSSIVTVKQNVTRTLMIYPNPAKDQIIMSFSATLQQANLTITDASGKSVIKRTNVSGSTLNVNISVLAAGAYQVRVVDNGIVYSSKLVKQ